MANQPTTLTNALPDRQHMVRPRPDVAKKLIVLDHEGVLWLTSRSA